MNARLTASTLLAFGLTALSSAMVAAQQNTLKDAAQKAVLSNPEVLQRWHAYQAAINEKDVAFGGYLPRLDLAAGAGREHRNDPLLKSDYHTHSTTLTLTQMLYDGFATRNEVKRLDHARQVRLFELFDASETAALEASRAYLDVLRYRKLVELAEENYVRHRAVFEQIQKKTQAGVGRRVDLEQASGRLALAEANLLTETANLHDVSARYQRLVGDVPAKTLAIRHQWEMVCRLTQMSFSRRHRKETRRFRPQWKMSAPPMPQSKFARPPTSHASISGFARNGAPTSMAISAAPTTVRQRSC